VRIVENEHAPEDAPIKKKKRGYAFVVFAEEYALKGTFHACSTGRVADVMLSLQMLTRGPMAS